MIPVSYTHLDVYKRQVEKVGVTPVLFHSPDELPLTGIEGFMATADRGPICRFIDQA